MKDSKVWKQFLVAAVASALASVFIVAVGPGFSAPNDSAADEAVEATADAGAQEEVTTTEQEAATTEAATTEEVNEAYVPDPDTTPGGGDDNPANASNSPDQYGHTGSGTGTSTGSQANPGDNENTEDVNDDRYQSNGPGTGDDDADECLNEESSVNGDTDPGTGGANESGPYDSTCDGRISQNGQGDGANGAGTPCAGCVGNADDKNPPGQVKEFNGQKANDMGYECDGNQGVGAHYGNGNPAHTGDCAPAEEEPPPPTTEYEMVCRQNADGDWETVQIVKGTRQATDKDVSAPECKKGGGGENPKLIFVCRYDDATNSWSVVGPIAPTDKQAGDKPADATTLPASCGKSETDGPTPKLVYVCRPNATGGWTVVGPIAPTDKLPGDKPADSTTTPADCGTVSGSNPKEPKKVTICHYTGSATNPYVIIEVSENALKNGHDETHGELNPVDISKCAPPPPPPPVDCNGDNDASNNNTCVPPVYFCPPGSPMAGLPVPGGNVNNCYYSPPVVCPAGSSMPGAPVPGGDVKNCYVQPPEVCPAGSSMPGQPVPGGDVKNCYIQPPEVCPAGSDMAGQPVPGGNVNNCYEDEVLPERFCPAGTDMAGQPVPPTGVKACNDDDVLDDRITNDGDVDGEKGDDVAAGGTGRGRKPLGGVLPFTGASILAYVLVGLQMIGAGALIARGRKAKK